MGHERYGSVDDILAERPVDVLARRLFETGGVTEVHANGSVVTVHLAEGWTGARLLDVIRGLYIFYPAAGNGEAPASEPAATEPEAAVEPEPEAAAEAAEPEAVVDPEPAVEPDATADREPAPTAEARAESSPDASAADEPGPPEAKPEE
jgi:hypothetical protein